MSCIYVFVGQYVSCMSALEIMYQVLSLGYCKPGYRDVVAITSRLGTRYLMPNILRLIGDNRLKDLLVTKGNALFNDALNTFYLRLYGVGYMVKDHSDSERGNLLPPHGLLFPISSKGSCI